MAYYLVRAKPHWAKLAHLRIRLDAGEIVKMHPFGPALDQGLRQARLENALEAETQVALWEEEDYCRPPLAQERAAVLDDYFTDLTVTPVKPLEGWAQIEHLPSLWAR